MILRKFSLRNRFCLSLVLVMLTPCALAQNASNLPAWEQLNPAQREQLIAPVRERWNSQPQLRARMLRNAQRWQQLDPQQRKHAQRGLQRLEQMTPQQRQQARTLYQHMRQLPEGQRRALREQLRSMTPEQRRAWMQQNANRPAPPKP